MHIFKRDKKKCYRQQKLKETENTTHIKTKIQTKSLQRHEMNTLMNQR